MTEAAGWGAPDFVPPAVARRMAREDAQEARETRLAEAERERLAEERHQRAMTLAVQQAEVRGEVLDTMTLARGEVRGRAISEILAAAVAAGAAADRGDEIRAWREGHGEPVHIEVGEPVIHTPAARSVTGRAIFNRARRFRDLLEARRQLERAERAAWQSRNDYGVVEGVTVRRREDRDDVVFARRQYEQACREIGQRPVSYR
jgi:hypothetical protein